MVWIKSHWVRSKLVSLQDAAESTRFPCAELQLCLIQTPCTVNVQPMIVTGIYQILPLAIPQLEARHALEPEGLPSQAMQQALPKGRFPTANPYGQSQYIKQSGSSHGKTQ